MAAILCRGIGSICTGIGECIGGTCKIICTGPCKACGAACSGIGQLCNSPFCMFVSIAIVSQLPPAIIGFTEVLGLPNCRGSIWLLVSALLSIINLSAAFYLSLRIQNKDDTTLQHLDRSHARASYLLCNDPWIAGYILLFITFFIWLCLGSAWNWNGITNEDVSCSDDVRRKVRMSIAFGWFFIIGGSIALTTSMCWAACFDKRDYAAGESSNNNNNNENTNNNANNATNDVENPPSSPAASLPPIQAVTGLPQQQQQSERIKTENSKVTTASVVEAVESGHGITGGGGGNNIPIAEVEDVTPSAPSSIHDSSSGGRGDGKNTANNKNSAVDSISSAVSGMGKSIRNTFFKP